MPIKNEEEQRIASRECMKRLRAQRKAEAEATNRKYEETIPDTPENLNYGMEPTKDKPLTWDEYLAENPKADKGEYIQYKLKWSYEHKWKSEIESEAKRRARDEQTKYGTRDHTCILWRRMYEKGQKSDFYYSHVESCKLCAAYYAKQKNANTLDLNASKDKHHYEEYDGYAQAFKSPEPYPEDYTGYPYPVPMNRMCPNCLSNLRPDGSCPICNPES